MNEPTPVFAWTRCIRPTLRNTPPIQERRIVKLAKVESLTGEEAQATLRGRPRGRLGTVGSGNGRLPGCPRFLGSVQGEGSTGDR
jgi:hypothetical protein